MTSGFRNLNPQTLVSSKGISPKWKIICRVSSSINNSSPTSGIYPFRPDQWSFGSLLDQWSISTSGLREFSKSTLMHVQSTKARALLLDQMIVDLLHCDPMTTVALSPEILIFSDLEYFLSIQRA
jgi:hypothetical protein